MSPVNVGSIGEYIRQQREQAKISLRQLASATGVSNPYLSQIERGLRRPSAEILQQIAKGLRISAEALYVQAGILEDRRPDSGVRAAVLADPELTERQKQVLLEIYESFRRELAAGAEDVEPAADAEPVGIEAGGIRLLACSWSQCAQSSDAQPRADNAGTRTDDRVGELEAIHLVAICGKIEGVGYQQWSSGNDRADIQMPRRSVQQAARLHVGLRL